MADEKDDVRANRDSDPEGMPEDPGGIVAKGPKDKVRANKDSKDSGDGE